MDRPSSSLQQEDPLVVEIGTKLTEINVKEDQPKDEPMVADDPKPKHRQVSRLKLKANPQPSAESGHRRFALHKPSGTDSDGRRSAFDVGLVSKERPKLFSSNRIFEWCAFQLERTHKNELYELNHDATPFKSLEHFIDAIYEAMADTSDDDRCEDRYLIWSKVTRHDMHRVIDPARVNGTIPKAARFTHFVPSNILIVKIPIDCHSSAGYLDIITKPIIGYAYSLGMGRELKLCGNTRYMAKIQESAVEGVDFDQPHPVLEKMAETNPGLVDGFGSFNECDAGFRPFKVRPYKFDTPSVVVESIYGSDISPLRYKACWWLQLTAGQVKAVILVKVDPLEQQIDIEVWRSEVNEPDSSDEQPTRVQKVVIIKKEEFKGTKEMANPEHFSVSGPLEIMFKDLWLTEPPEEGDCNLHIGEAVLAHEAADLWFGDGMLVNDWIAARDA